MARECLALAGTGARIVVEGPLARNASVCGLLAALAGVPVHPSPDATGTALGAALLLDPPGAPSGALPAASAAPLAVAGLPPTPALAGARRRVGLPEARSKG